MANSFAEDPYSAETSAARRADGGDGGQFERDAGADGSDEFEGYDPGAAPRRGIDDTELLELSATTLATELDMDWDDEELDTRHPEDGPPPLDIPSGRPSPFGPSTVSTGGQPSPFPPSMAGRSSHPGNPSPFAPVSSMPPAPRIPSFAPPATTAEDDWESEDEAATRVMPSVLPPSAPVPAFPAHAPPPPTIQLDAPPAPAEWPDERPKRQRQAMIALAAVALVGLAIGARALLSGADTGTVTLVTTPIDAQVSVDGRPLLGQTSPFTLQGLAGDVEHEIEVVKEGFETQTRQFTLAGGEVRSLSPVELSPLNVETGFALDSKPSGATIFVDDAPLDKATPARVTDLSAGLHTIRLEREGGFQPWQTQVALAEGQLIELPLAVLVAGTAAAAPARVASSQDDDDGDDADEARERRRARRAQRRAERAERSAATAGPSTSSRFAAAAAARRTPAPAAAGGGRQGTLRINSRPWSQVFVDGRLVGNTPQMNVPLSAGRHKIKLVNSQMGMSKRLNVTVEAGKVTTKVVNLME